MMHGSVYHQNKMKEFGLWFAQVFWFFSIIFLKKNPNLCLQNFDFTYFFLFSDEGRGSIYIFGGYTDRYKVKYI